MKYDGEIDIATGLSAKSKKWSNAPILWSELVARLGKEHKTTETYSEYIAASKEEQLKIKDVGGYVGGYLRGGRRKPENVVHRQLLALDLDFAHIDFWSDYELLFDNAAVLHSTHKHHESSPRYRLVMPLSREVSPDEYAAVSRQIAGQLGIELFDNTTFETNRLMFWPSNPEDTDYYFEYQDGPWVDVDEQLGRYLDWQDSSLWPTSVKHTESLQRATKKQEDPELKKGVIGAFCRTYPISAAIEEFLSEEYADLGDGRYTYTKGSTAAGLVTYDDKFSYSHHGTDPSSGKLCNAFDLVRIHKFSHLDEDGKTTKSFQAMTDFAREDKEVRKNVASFVMAEASYDFAEELEVEQDDVNWMENLEMDSKNRYLSSAKNLTLIFTNDIRLKGLFKQNSFDNKQYVCGTLPWRKVTTKEPVRDVDYSGVRNYIETIYGITGSLKIDDALKLEFERNTFHPIKDYLKSLEWDGVKRADGLLIEYFGAEDTQYSREAMKKMLVASVARVYNPGVKYDLVLTLVSQQQGTGKSSFFKALGRQWFSDTFMSVQGKDALEQIQGAWIIEMAELAGIRKAEVEAVKHFITKQEDMFRPAYARTTETFKRQCVFVATTNQTEFLKDATGNRRFLPVTLHDKELANNEKLKKFITDDAEIDQVWAEAVALYKKGEPLYLTKNATEMAVRMQSRHVESDGRAGMILDYLDIPLLEEWNEMDIHERRDFLTDPLSPDGTVLREYVCAAEIWCECFGMAKEKMDRYKTREINELMKSFDEWEYSGATRRFKIYGAQRYYSRKLF